MTFYEFIMIDLLMQGIMNNCCVTEPEWKFIKKNWNKINEDAVSPGFQVALGNQD